MVLPIVHYNASVLRQKGAPVAVFDGALAQLAADMIESMHEAEGIGLAAQQVGRALQLCVIDLRGARSKFNWELDGRRVPLDLFMPLVLVNPQLKLQREPTDFYEEGCLSFPEIRGDVERPDVAEVTYQDLDGGQHTLVCDGLLSRCVQHEYDHLQGVLFIDRMPRKVRQELDAEIKELARLTREATTPSS